MNLERRVDEARFTALVTAVNTYLKSGGATAGLTSARLVQAGLIRGDWLGGPSIRISDGLWVNTSRGDTVEVGTFGSRGALASLKAAYAQTALKIKETQVATPENSGGDAQLELIVMTFDHNGLERAAHFPQHPHPEVSLGRRVVQAKSNRGKAYGG